MAVCKACGQKAWVTETRVNSKGDVRRRLKCKVCDHSWSEWNGEKPKSPAPDIRLSEDVIRDILTDRSPQPVLAERHSISCSAVGRIRRGELHSDVLPELERFKAKPNNSRKTCKLCIHYTGSSGEPCDLGLVDPKIEGLRFASYCPTFFTENSKDERYAA